MSASPNQGDKVITRLKSWLVRHFPGVNPPPALVAAAQTATRSQLNKMCTAFRRSQAERQSSRLEAGIGRVRAARETGAVPDAVMDELLQVADESVAALSAHEDRAARSRAPALQRAMAGQGSPAAPTDIQCLDVASLVLGAMGVRDERWAEGDAAQVINAQARLLSVTAPLARPALLRKFNVPFPPTSPIAWPTQLDRLVAWVGWYAGAFIPPGVLSSLTRSGRS
jgi:hypothetical protein